MTSRFAMRAVGTLAALATMTLAGCNCGEPCNPELDDTCIVDAGQPPPDFCDTPEEGRTDTANCVLPLACGIDGGRTAFINPPDDGGVDQDWYSAQFGTLNARTLLRVNAGYTSPATPIDLTVTILRENASMSLARKVDDHGQGAPRPIDILMPYTESNTKLLFLLSDRGGRPPVFDIRNPYYISVCTQENPDVNEPNDAADAGTAIPLTAMGAVLRGTNTGYIATDNDVDRFKFDVPAAMPGPRNLIHVRVSTAMAFTAPPPPYRLSFILYDPNGVALAEQVTANAFLQADLSTAKLVRTPGQYTVVVQGYKPNPNDPAVVQGDLRQQYTVDVQVMEDLDTQEPNDSIAEAMGRARMLGPGNSVSITGKLSYTPDPEFFAFDLPPNAGHSTLHARLTSPAATGRFPQLAGPRDRQVRIMAAVPGGNLASSINSCLNDPLLCPKGYRAGDVGLQNLVSRTCTGFADAGAAQCLWLERNQHNDSPNFANLRNMEGSIPIPPHGGTLRYWVIVQDDGNNWADDVDWTLTVSSANDPDEARFTAGPVSGSIPGMINGQLTYGYGRTFNFDLARCAERPATDCRGARSPFDYDAVASDFDRFAFNLTPGMDQAWGLQWEIDKVDGGTVPAELTFELNFCGFGDGGCTQREIAYTSDNFFPWYSTQTLTDRIFGWTRQDMGSFVRITANLNQCLCLQSSLTQLQMNVGVVDREWYGPITYRVTQTSGAYSGVFVPDDGGMRSCSAMPITDGGMAACRLPR